jgi:alpha-galactosidase
MTQPKIVVLGAGSAVFGLKAVGTILRSEKLRGSEVCFVDIDEAALTNVVKLAEKANAEWGSQMRIRGATDRRDVLRDANFVVVSVQVGPREEVWEKDWRIPLARGVRQPYAENGGPGSFAHTARNLPLMIDIARDMEALCPNALYMNFVNPLIRLTLAVSRYSKIKVVGLCHQLLWGYAMAMAVLSDRYGISLPDGFNVHTNYTNMKFLEPVMKAAFKHLDLKASGINHFSWLQDIRDRRTGEDLYPLLKQRWLNGYRKDFEPFTRTLFEIFGMMPTPGDAHLEFTQWTHDPINKPWEKYHLELQSWDGNRKRRADRRQTTQEYIDGSRSLDELKKIETEGISEIVEAVTFNANLYHHQINLPNTGQIPNLPLGAIVETPATISGFGIRPINMPALPEPIAELCRRELAYSSLMVDACYHGDRDLALQALLLDPMMNDIDTARAILSDFLTEFREYLPQFWK